MILTDTLLQNLNNTNIEPIIVLEIEGVPFIIGSETIKKTMLYGDPDIYYGDPGLVYGGLAPLANQKSLISLEGTTTQIKQNLSPDKARTTGVSQMTVALVDKNQEATKLVAGMYGEILYKKVVMWLSFGQSSFKKDFIVIFRGIIESVSAAQGKVLLNLNSPQQKQRQLVAPKVETKLNGAITNVQTTITLDSIDNLIFVPDSPGYSTKDDTIKTYVKIGDEIIRYTGFVGLSLTGCTRGQFLTTAVAHADNDTVTSFYEIDGLNLDIALKLMLSDEDQTPYINDLSVTRVNWNGFSVEPNTFWFNNIDLTRDYNVQIGDWVKTAGMTESGNNLSAWTEILDVVVVDSGSYILVNTTLTNESTATGTIDMLSQWNTFGFGLKLDTNEVDIDKHLQLRNSFLNDFQLRFYLVEEINDAREWIEKELYLVSSCYSLPTDRAGLARVSVGIHKPPIPGSGIVTLNRDNIKKPDTIAIKRSINKYHYNAVLFLYEDSPTDDVLKNRNLTIIGTQSVPTGNKALVIESRGLKDLRDAKVIADAAGQRLLNRYKDAAEYLEGVEVSFGDGVQIVAGDIVVLDGTGLNLISNSTMDRNKAPLLMEVVNKSVDIKTASVKLDLIDTSFNIDARFGIISPSSKVRTVLSPTKFVITYLNAPHPSYGLAEYRKWDKLKLPGVVIRTADFTSAHSTKILSIVGNTVTIQTAPSFPILADMIMEFCQYGDSNTIDEEKLIYAYLSDGTNPFPDTKSPYVFI